MRDNPFSPSFSIRPERFYGRERELGTMREALRNPDSPNRFLFLTGTRGCGKTSLLHQFAELARREAGWTALETTYRDCVEALADFSGERAASTRSLSFSPSVSVAGVSASAVGVGLQTAAPPRSSLARPFAERAARESRRGGGVLVAVDEVQKISERDMEEVSHALQAAKTAGASVALVIAGLPLAYSRVRGYPGCTFVQRMRRGRLGMFGIADTRGFLESTFALVPEISLPGVLLDEMAAFSGGHPYLLQLVGSYAYEAAASAPRSGGWEVVELGAADVAGAERRALADYRENILRNLLSGLREGTLDYLRAMCDVSDERSLASSSDVAAALGKTTRECSSQRARVIDLQLAVPAGRGRLRFTLPYMPLAFEVPEVDFGEGADDAWSPRKTPPPWL